LKFLSSKSSSCLGLDIGSSAIKCVELTGSLRSPKVKVWGIQALPSGSIEEGSIVNQDNVVEAMQLLLNRTRTKTKNVAIAVNSLHAITKVIPMSSDMSENELEDVVESEASHFVPYAIEDVNLDFQVLGKTKGGEDQQDVLIAACRTDIVDDYVSVIEEVGLQPSLVDIDNYALERLYLNEHKPSSSTDVVAVFDIGVNSAKLIVFAGEEMIFNRIQKFGGSQLMTMVRQEYGLSAEEALNILESESPPADIGQKVFLPYYSQIAGELNRALQFFYSSSEHKKVNKVLFTGGVVNLPNFANAVGKHMGVNAGDLSLLSNFKISGNRDALMSKTGRLSVATGLALRGISG